MKSLKKILQESLRIGINDKPGLCPEDWQELKDIIDERLQKSVDLDLNDIDISNISSLDRLFADSKVKRINISDWDVSNVDNCEFMFGHCTSLEFVDMKNWKPKKFISVKDMFLYCRSFGDGPNVDVSYWKENRITMHILSDLYNQAVNPDNEIKYPRWFEQIIN